MAVFTYDKMGTKLYACCMQPVTFNHEHDCPKTPAPAHPGPWRVDYDHGYETVTVKVVDAAGLTVPGLAVTAKKGNPLVKTWEATYARIVEAVNATALLSQYREALTDMLGTLEIVLAENGQRGNVLSETMRHVFEGHVDDYRALLARLKGE